MLTELEGAGTNGGRIDARDRCVHCRDSGLADSLSLFSGSQDMQVLSGYLKRWGILCVGVWFWCFEVRTVSNSRESVALFHFCYVLKNKMYYFN